MPVKPRLLAAVTDLGYVHVRRALGDAFDLVPAFSMLQARAAIKSGDLDGIVCSIHFDESRMFELLGYARHAAPALPFICCRALHSPLGQHVLDGIAQAAMAQGAVGFIDFHEMQRREGRDEAAKRFCERVSALLVAPPNPTARQRLHR